MKRFLVGLSLLALASCQDGLGPASNISGRWVASRVEYSLTLDLEQRDLAVSGTAHSWAFINPPTQDYAVTGSYQFPYLLIMLTANDTFALRVIGTVQDSKHFGGVLHFRSAGDTLTSDTLTFTRQ